MTASGTVDLRPTGPGQDLWSGGGAEQNPVNESEGEDTAVVLTEWFADGPVGYRRGIGNRSLVSHHPATGKMA